MLADKTSINSETNTAATLNEKELVDLILRIERVYSRPGPNWRLMTVDSSDNTVGMSPDEFRRYLIEKNIPEEYWINYRRTQRGNFIENAKVIPYSLLSEGTKREYKQLAQKSHERFHNFQQSISKEKKNIKSTQVRELIQICIGALTGDIQQFLGRNRERPKESSVNKIHASYVQADIDFYCRYQAAKLFQAITKRDGILEQKIINDQFQPILNEILQERFARFGDRTPAEIFRSLIRQHGERPTPFLREDPDLYEFFRRGLLDLGPLPSPFPSPSPASDNDHTWHSAVLGKIVRFSTNIDDVTSLGEWSFERPATASGTRAFVRILKDSSSKPVSVIKIAIGPDRLEEILSELALDGYQDQAILPKAWGRFGDDTFFALYPFAQGDDEDQRYATLIGDTKAAHDFSKEYGKILAAFHTQSISSDKNGLSLLATYRDSAQRVYNLSYDVHVLEKRLESARPQLSRNVQRVIAAYRNILVCHPTSFETGVVHGDLYPSNIFRTANGYQVIDNNQAAYYVGRISATGDPAQDVGKSVGYLLVEWARRQRGDAPALLISKSADYNDLLGNIDTLVQSYVYSRKMYGSPIIHEEQFRVGIALHACSYAAKNWTDIRGLKFTPIEGGPATDVMRSSLFAAVESYLERVTIPHLSYESSALDRFLCRPGELD